MLPLCSTMKGTRQEEAHPRSVLHFPAAGSGAYPLHRAAVEWSQPQMSFCLGTSLVLLDLHGYAERWWRRRRKPRGTEGGRGSEVRLRLCETARHQEERKCVWSVRSRWDLGTSFDGI
jgi:hypothetical protein